MNWLNSLLFTIKNGTKIGGEQWLENVKASLDIMWKGVLAIFIVIAVVIVVVVLLNKIVKFFADKRSQSDGEDE